MSSAEERFHEEWLGMVQPVDGLVVSIPALVEAQCASRQPPELQRTLAEQCPSVSSSAPDGERAISDLDAFLTSVLGWCTEDFVTGDALPEALSLYVPEGRQTLLPTLALRAPGGNPLQPLLLLWDTGPAAVGLPFDKPETVTGPWEYPVSAKLDRLLRHTKIPIGVLTNRTHVRLVYAPHGESSGSITFRVADMTSTGGRPILDALVMLLGATRLTGVAPDRQLSAILADSRKRQANVTNDLADQVLDALQILLRGFEAAAERDGRAVLDAAYELPDNHLYGGLLTQLLRLVFVLYAEDRGLLPVDQPLYAGHLSALGLYEELLQDRGAYPDAMARRFGAYGRLVALFRSVFLGVEHCGLRIPARRGALFSPHDYPFLEGWPGPPGSAPIVDPAARAATVVPSVDDETVFRVLDKLLVLKHQRLSYRALDVEQIGSVYEAVMGYRVWRLPADAICLRGARVWVTAEEALEPPPATRARRLQEATGLAKAQAEKLAKALATAQTPAEALEALAPFAIKENGHLPAGRLVIQPGPERRRTSSHYTPRSLTEPIVRKTLEPLFRAMGDSPPSSRILNLKICDPAVGSGAFLVAACRYIADQLVLAWTREGRHDLLGGSEDATLRARRLIAQRCLYGVDKNPFAVNLAKLSLWLVTLARELPFTFLDHALRHGDSLVGLSLDQITAFHWKPTQQQDLCKQELEATLDEAIKARARILELASDPSPQGQREKERLLTDADDALEHVRLIGDLVVGAFFEFQTDKERERERLRRQDLVLAWLRTGGGAPPAELIELRDKIRARIPVFHWMAEMPEVFWDQRPDPLDDDAVGEKAWMDAFVGNPPFMGVAFITEQLGNSYVPWLQRIHPGTQGKFDLVAHFFRRTNDLLGEHGTIGLIATNTIAQGDTRATGLQHLLAEGLIIRDATKSLPWPGDAAVTVAVVHLEKGRLVAGAVAPRFLEGVEVRTINSRLRAGEERPDPRTLRANAELSFVGSYVLGMGFVLTPETRDALVMRNPRNAERIFPFLGGEEVNTSPTQNFDRYVINFGDMTIEEAGRWPDLLAIVREGVKAERDLLRDNADGRRYKANWWLFGRSGSGLYAAIGNRKRCLVCAIVTKHLMFSFQPAGRIFSHKLFVFPFDQLSQFGLLQSRMHGSWAWLLSSTMRDAGINYSASDCFETFPFPDPDPRAVIPALEDIGARLYDARAAYMVATNQGLTQTYNRLKDPECAEPEIVALRDLHVEMDRRVLAAYGWSDIDVPPYTTPATDADRRALVLFEDTVIDRLFALNAIRAAAEEAAATARAPAPAAKRAKPAARPKPAPVAQIPLADIIPFPHVERPKPADKFKRYIPLYSFRLAAGAFSEIQEREIKTWISPTISTAFTKGMFAARIDGHSMEPEIPDGAFALFQSPWLTPRDGQIGAFTEFDEAASDTAARITIKRYRRSFQRIDGEPRIGGALDPDNPAYRPISITENVRPYARFIAVLLPEK